MHRSIPWDYASLPSNGKVKVKVFIKSINYVTSVSAQMYSYNNENHMSLIGSTVFARLTGVPNRETNT